MPKSRIAGWFSSKAKRKSTPANDISRRRAKVLAAAIESLEDRILLSAATWVGGTGNWNVAANWSDNAVPVLGDTVTIAALHSIVNVTDSQRITQISTSVGTTLNISSAGALEVDSGGTVGGSLTVAGQIGDFNGLMTLSGASNVSGSFFQGAFSNTGTLALDDASLGNGAQVTNNGTLNITNTLSLGSSSSLNNTSSDTIDLQDDGNINGSGTINNSGLFEKSAGAGTSTIASGNTFNDNGGTIDLLSGSISDAGSASFQGTTFEAVANSSFGLDDSSGQYRIAGTITSSGAGHLLFDAGSVFPGTPSAQATTSILDLSSGFAQITGSAFNVNGQDGLVQEVTNSGYLNYTGTTQHGNMGLLNSGTIEVTGAGDIGISSSGSFTNESTGVLDFAADASLISLGGNTAFNNAGTIEKTAGTGTSSLNFDGVDSGPSIVDAETGTLDFPAGYNFNGTSFTAATGATISLDDTAGGNDFGVTGTLTGSGAGNLIFASGGVVPFNPNGPAPTAILNFPTGFAQITGSAFNVNGQDGPVQEITNSGFLNYIGANQHGNMGLINTGTIVVAGTGDIGVSSSGSFTNESTGILDFTADATLINFGGNTAFNNAGTIEKTAGTGISSIDFPGVDFGPSIVDAETGTLEFAAGYDFDSTSFTAASGATISLNDTAGGNDFGVTGTLTGSGAGNLIFASGGVVPFNPNGPAPTAILNFPTGFAQITGGAFNINPQDGPVQEITNSGFLNYIGANQHGNMGLINQGSIEVLGTGDLDVDNNGSFDNTATGIINFQSDGGIANFGGNTSFTNAGLIEKTGGVGTSVIGDGLASMGFDNTGGAFDVETGTLSLENGQESFTYAAGLITVATGATFDINAGNADIHGSGAFTSTGAGRVTFSGGSWRNSSAGPSSFDFAPGVFVVTAGIFADSNNDINTGAMTFSGPTQINGLTNQGTLTFADTGPLSFSGTLVNDATGAIDFQDDSGINIVGNNTLQNNGTILKSGGAGTLDLSNVSLINAGTIRSESGTINLPYDQDMFVNSRSTIPTGTTFEADAGAAITLQQPFTPLTTIDGTVILSGAGSSFNGLSGLTTINGTFEVLSGASFTTAGSLTNTGVLTVGGSLTVTGDLTETQATGSPTPPPPTLNFSVAAPVGTPGAPNLTVDGNTTLAGNLTAEYSNGFGGTGGNYTVANFTNAATGSFADTSGTGPAFTPTINPTSIILNATTGGSSDLAVTNLSAPTTFTDGQSATITWTVANQGQANAAGNWIDAVYLSKSATLDSSAILLGTQAQSGPVASSGTYQSSLNINFPAVTAGNYFVIVVTDAQSVLSDANRANNSASSAALGTVPVLTLGGNVTGTVFSGQGLVYQLTVPGGEDVLISEALNVPLENRLDVSESVIPTASGGQYSATLTPGSTATSVNLKLPQAGTYYILLTGNLAALGGQTFTLSAQQVPFALYSASPNAVGQGKVTINVTGSGFTAASTVQLLTSTGTPDATGVVTLIDNDTLSVSFDLTTIPTGPYGLRVTTGNNSATLPAAVTVQAATAKLSPVQYQINAVTVFRPGDIYDMFITYTNPNNVDIPAPVFELDEPDLSFRLVGGDPGSHLQPGLGFTAGALQLLAINQEGVAGTLPAGYTGTYEVAFQAPADTPIDTTFTPTINDDPIGTDGVDLTTLSQSSDYSSLTWAILAAEMNGQSSLPVATYGNVSGYEVDGDLQDMNLSVTDAGYEAQLRATANALSAGGVYDPDAYDLLNYSLSAADQFGAVTARMKYAPTLSLTPNYGSFGVGSPDPLYYAITVNAANGEINVVMPTATDSFVATVDSNGITYVPLNPDDSESLSTQPDDTYRLTEKDGSFYQFNSKSRLAYFQAASGQQTVFNYNTKEQVTSIVDSNGGTTTYAYDPTYGVVTSTTDPYGNTAVYGYELDNSLAPQFGTNSPMADIPLLKTITTSAGTTTIAYTASPSLQSPITRIYLPESGSYEIDIHFVWDGSLAQAYLPTSITLPDGSGELFSYNGLGQLIQTSQLDGSEQTNYSYDASGLEVTATYGSAVSTTILSVDGSVLKTIDPNGAVSTYNYAASGLLSSILSPTGAVTSFAYNADGTLGAQTSAIGNTSTMTYDSQGRMTTITDANGNVVGLAYDANGNLKSVTQPDNTSEQYQYTSAGVLNQLTQRDGVVVSIGHDAFGDITSQVYSSGASYSYTYDSQGNMLTADGPDGKTTYTYNSANYVTSVQGPDGHTLVYTYNSLGEVASLSNDGVIISNYSYDVDARLQKVTDGSGALVIQYSYDTLGRISMETFGNGTSTVYAYNSLGETLSITNLSAAKVVTSSLTYTYDLAGQPTSVMDAQGNLTQYAYDLLGQLITVTLPNSGGAITYTYDANGNRVSVFNSGVTTSYTVNNMDEYTAVGLTTYTYDKNGNMATMTDSSGATTYTYNANDQLISSSGPAGNFTYTYDALFQLIAYTDNGVLTTLVRGPVGNVVAAYDANGNLLENYQIGLGLVAATSGSGASLYYQSDAVGNVTATTNGAGSIVNTYSYLPFGEKLSSTGPSDNIFTFSGSDGVMDLGDGMYQTLSRTYSPTLGRFLQNDPEGEKLSGNLYEYAGNAPTDGIDPTGEETEPAGEESPAQGSYVKYGGDVVEEVGGGAAVSVDSNGDWYLTADAQAGVNANVQAGRHSGSPSLGLSGIANAGIGAVGPHVEVERNLIGGAGEPETEVVPGVSRQGSTGLNLSVGGAITVNLTQIGRHLGPQSWQLNQPEVPWQPDPRLYGPRGGKIFGTPQQRQRYKNNLKQYHRGRAFKKLFGPQFGDPNDIFGPAGYGAAGYVAPSAFPYTIVFANEPTATAPAPSVVITQQLSANLDWSTFQLQGFGFGSFNFSIPAGLQSYDTKVDVSATLGVIVDVNASFNASTGLLTWTFTSLDPTTMLPTTNALAGFLPPDDAAGDGEGYVNYIISPKTSDTTGTTIQAQATIVFGNNAAIPTPLLTNTIDNGDPTSSVSTLPSTETSRSFLVQWSGQDDTNGSGIASYDVYVSDNGGAFTPFVLGSTGTSAIYTGQDGHTYSFYSVANDNVANQQLTPSAQASTTVSVPMPTFTLTTPLTITYGASTTTFSGTLAVGGNFVPSGDTVAITLAGGTLDATVGANGVFSVDFNTSLLPASTTPYDVTYTFNSDPNFAVVTTDSTLTVNQASQVITFGPLGSVTVGVPPITLSATSTSGLPVSFTLVSGPANLSGNILTITGVGTVVIDATQIGDSNYLAASPVEQDLQVNAANTNATLFFTGNENPTYNGKAQPLKVTTSPAGLKGVTIVYTLNGQVVANPIDAGTYNVVATLNNPKYTASPISTTLVIAQATPVFSGLSASSTIEAGTPNTTFSGVISVGKLFPPAGELVTITINGISHTANIGAKGKFSLSFPTAALPASNTPYSVTYTYNGDTNFAPASNSTTTKLTVAPAVATQFIITSPSNETAGTPFNFTIIALDQFGNIVTGYNGTVHFTSTDGAALLPPNATLNNGTGTFTATLNTPGNQTITATDTTNSALHGTTGKIDVTAATTGEKLVFLYPPAGGRAGNLAPITVLVENSKGQLVLTDHSSVTLTVASGPGTLGGAFTVKTILGVAVFTNLSLTTAGTYTLRATDGSDTVAISKPFTITAAAPARLVIAQQPNNTTAGNTLNPIVVDVEDRFGNIVTNDNSLVTLSLASSPTNARLKGDLTVRASHGVATFSNLSITTAGTYKLRASDDCLTSAVSNSFKITPGVATHLAFLELPTKAKHDKTFSVEVELLDKYNNLVPTTGSTITLSLASHPKNAMLSGKLTASTVNGIATFNNLEGTQPGCYTLFATDKGLSSITSPMLDLA